MMRSHERISVRNVVYDDMPGRSIFSNKDAKTGRQQACWLQQNLNLSDLHRVLFICQLPNGGLQSSMDTITS